MVTNSFEKARAIAPFAKVMDKGEVYVPGNDAKIYSVIVKRRNGNILTECRLLTGNGTIPCRGNSYSVCYHSLAAVIALANKGGYKVMLCHSKSSAAKVKNIVNGKVVSVTSRQSHKRKFIVYYRDKSN